jgi:molybdopterin/thiamine biosynthesis adenylyltransferase
MPSRFVLVGCGGIGSQLLAPLVRYLRHRSREALLVLVDGDVFEPGNALRQQFPASAVGSNKAEALAGWVREAGLACQAVPLYLDEGNVDEVIREGDLVLLAVDNHRTRALVDRHIGDLREATLISGGNDETDGNVQLVRRRGGFSLDGTLSEIHPEIATAIDGPASGDGCAAQVAEHPQLLVMNLMVASAMLNCLWAVCEIGSAPYSEVYLDVVQNAARPRRWQRAGADAA